MCRALLLMVVVVVMLVNMQGRGSEAQLVENFYSSSCPNVESIVKQAVSTKFSQTFTTIPATLRLFFHDCFVEVHISYSFLYSSCTFKLKIHVIYDIMIPVNQSIIRPFLVDQFRTGMRCLSHDIITKWGRREGLVG